MAVVGKPWPGFAVGALAESVVRVGTPDEEDILGKADRQVNAWAQ